MGDVKKKLEDLLHVRFAKLAKIQLPKERLQPFLDKNLLLEDHTLINFERFGLKRDAFIKQTKSYILERSGRSDPLQTILAEKIAEALFHLSYLDDRYPNSILLAGETSLSNKFVIELEYIRTLLLHQISFLSDALSLTEGMLNEIKTIERDELSRSMPPTKAKRKVKVPKACSTEEADTTDRGRGTDNTD